MTDLFEMGHSASSARHAHEQKLLYETETKKQLILADRAKNPNPQDICRLYNKWRLGSYGKDNGKGLFQKLQEATDRYNSQNESDGGGGKAFLQWYKCGENKSKFQAVKMKMINQQQRKGKQSVEKSVHLQ